MHFGVRLFKHADLLFFINLNFETNNKLIYIFLQCFGPKLSGLANAVHHHVRFKQLPHQSALLQFANCFVVDMS